MLCVIMVDFKKQLLIRTQPTGNTVSRGVVDHLWSQIVYDQLFYFEVIFIIFSYYYFNKVLLLLFIVIYYYDVRGPSTLT